MEKKLSEKNKDFFEQVYQIVKMIPKGRVTSYGAIANYLGAKSGARMVGWAMNASHTISDVPAHRVVNRLGILSGKAHFSSPHAMQEQLEAEGVIIKDYQVVDFERLFWDPREEIEDLSI